MSTFGKSLSRELGKNTGKWVSNKVFGDNHATPHKIIHQRQTQQRQSERIASREYHEHQKQLERERRENEKELKRLATEEAEAQKLLMISNNNIEVEEHNKYIEVIQSVHKDYSGYIDWNEISNQNEPDKIQTAEECRDDFLKRVKGQVEKEVSYLQNKLKPSFGKKMYDKVVKDKYKFLTKALFKEEYNLEQEIKENIIDTKKSIDNRLTKALEKQGNKRLQYEEELQNHKELLTVADGVLQKNKDAFNYAINLFNPFQDLKEYGSDISFSIDNENIKVDFYVHSEEVLPNTTKKIQRKGLEIKEENIAPTRFNEIYQDYVCSCILRIAKETFQLLPIKNILINAKGSILNSSTGNYEEKIIVSVDVERAVLEKLNFNLLDPSDSMENFSHNMSFTKKEGFSPVEEINLNKLSAN